MSLDAFRKARAGEKRSQALAAASTLFRQTGFERTSMEAVANAAGISTATLYRQFPSKESLFEAVAVSALDRLDAPVLARGGVKFRMTALAVSYAELLAAPETRGFMRMIIAETGRNPRLADIFYEKVKARLGGGFLAVYGEGAAQEIFKRTSDPGHAVGQLQGMIEHAVLMRGLILGDGAAPLKSTKDIARSAVETWLARWAR